MHSPFGAILQQAVESTPGAIGGALAAGDGELVDSFTIWEHADWAILTAHMGILVNQIRSALHTFHFGDVQFLYVSYHSLELIVQIVDGRYYMLLAVEPPVQLSAATQTLRCAADLLYEEMV